MIVDMYFGTTYYVLYKTHEMLEYKDHYEKENARRKKDNDAVVQYMKAMPDDTRFIFLITTSQTKAWDNWIKEYELKDLIRFQMPRPITNIVHKESGRRILLYVLSKTPLKEHEYGNTLKSTEACTY